MMYMLSSLHVFEQAKKLDQMKNSISARLGQNAMVQYEAILAGVS